MMKKELANVVFEMEKLNEGDLKKLFNILCDKIGYEPKEEKTLDDFTMEEVLEYAKAYKGIPIKLEKSGKYFKNPIIELGAKKVADITYEELKEFISMKVNHDSNLLNELVSVSSLEDLKKLYKFLIPTEDWLKHLYNTRNDIKLSDDNLAYLIRNSFDSRFRNALIKLFKNGNLNYFAAVSRDKQNIIKPTYDRIVRRSYANIDSDNVAEPFRKLIGMLVEYLNNSLEFCGPKEFIQSAFKCDQPSDCSKTTLEKISDVVGVNRVLSLLNDMGFDKPSIDMIKSKTFICNISTNYSHAQNARENLMISSSYAIALNELTSFNISGYKIYDIYSRFMDHVHSLMVGLKPQDQYIILETFVNSCIFGIFDIYYLCSCKREMLSKNFTDLLDVIEKVRKHNIKIPKNPKYLIKPINPEITISKIKWLFRPTSYVVKNPQTVVYYLLKLGITNKQLQKLLECSSVDVILAAKDHNHWLNNTDNWKRGSIKELCLLCIKKGVSYRRLDQILCCGGNNIYQYYNQIIKEDPSVVSHLEIIK